MALTEALREARALTKQWNGGELPVNPSYKQLIGFTVRMLDKLIGGELTKTGEKQIKTSEKIAVTHSETGKPTTRKRQEKVAQYTLFFPDSGKAELTALDRVNLLKKTDL